MIVYRVFSLILISSPLVYGTCYFSTEAQTKTLNEKFSSWNIQSLTISWNQLTYVVGLCQSLDNNNTAIIQRKGNSSSVLGRLQHVNAIEYDNWILLTYQGGDRYNGRCDNNSRTASLMLVCGSNKTNLIVLQDDSNNQVDCNFMFRLEVPQLCPSIPVPSKKLSGGAIFLIIFFSLITVYLVAGGAFMHFKRGARGLEHIPNLNLWRQLGGLAADGCDFCCRCERPVSRAGYFLQESEIDMNTESPLNSKNIQTFGSDLLVLNSDSCLSKK